jgi:uncharacterized protein
MSLREKIQQSQKEAMKARDTEKTSILRMLWAAIRNAEIEKKDDLGNDEIIQIVKRQVKQANDSLKDFESGGRNDLVEKTKKEIEMLSIYLPEQMSDDDLKEIVKKVIEDTGASSPSDIGKVMGGIMKEVGGKADGNRVKEVVASFLK